MCAMRRFNVLIDTRNRSTASSAIRRLQNRCPRATAMHLDHFSAATRVTSRAALGSRVLATCRSTVCLCRSLLFVTTASNITARTQFLQAKNETYAYRRFGSGPGHPLLFLQHFMGTLDNWDPAVTDPLASGREVILFDNAGVGRSTGRVPDTVQGMAMHALAFLDGLGVTACDVLGFSLGGMVAQQIARERPSLLRKVIFVGPAPRGGEDIMHLEKPALAKHIQNPTLQGYARLTKIFFARTQSSQAAGEAFVGRLSQRRDDLDPASGAEVAAAHNGGVS